MLTVYHTSPDIVDSPDVYHSRTALDFGPGFYVTPLRPQALEYGKRFWKSGKCPYLNQYRLDEDYKKSYRVKVFDNYDEEWLDYVVSCRRLQEREMFDVVIGGIANDRVFNTINLYLDGLIDKRETLSRLIYEQPNIQICITNQEVIDKYLKFIKSMPI
ncbi:MAG: DUF3990 domain-containing protein [Bacteroidales bacterium]|nr:DUF3990 domain-containing protein [Bacteroidales bacterium]